MLSHENGQRLPTSLEREACKNGTGGLCHGITSEPDLVRSLSLIVDRERDEIRQNIDWVSGHCQTTQCTSRAERKNLPCFKLRAEVFRLNK